MEPMPSSDLAFIIEPCAVTISFTNASPRPVPPYRRVDEGIQLKERFKNLSQTVRRNTDTGIFHFDHHQCIGFFLNG